MVNVSMNASRGTQTSADLLQIGEESMRERLHDTRQVGKGNEE